MTRSLITGDTHGNYTWVKKAVERAVELGAKQIIQLGDFGIWPGDAGKNFLNHVENLLVKYDKEFLFVDGNHDDHEQLKYFSARQDGMHVVRDHILHLPRGYSFDLDGWKVVACGGAVSVDKAFRTPGLSWWPEEIISVHDEDATIANESCDVLLTHDCSPQFPFKRFKLRPHFESNLHQKITGSIAEVLRPSLWLHGHMHINTSYIHVYHTETGADDISVHSLGCDGMSGFTRLLITNEDSMQLLSEDNKLIFETYK